MIEVSYQCRKCDKVHTSPNPVDYPETILTIKKFGKDTVMMEWECKEHSEKQE